MKQIIYTFSFLFLITLAIACSNQNKETKTTQEGEKLAAVYCQSCHLLPNPNLLTKNLWQNHVLPKMGHFMGIYQNDTMRNSLIENNEGGRKVVVASVFPEKPMLTNEEWLAIQAYYIENAPDSFNIPLKKINAQTSLFTAIIPPNKFSPPSTTLLKFNAEGGLYFGDANTMQFLKLKKDFSIQLGAEIEQGAVCVNENESNLWVTVMGSFSPTDNPLGLLVKLPKNGKTGAKIEIENLQRPVHTSMYDMNADGMNDFVISEFGKFTGALSLFTQQKNGTFTKQILWAKPGATKTQIIDMNNDGKPDIVALFAQADEGIDVYYNLGNNKYERKRLISFPPSYGSTNFSLIDLNNDKHLDIVYTCGDNADFSMILRPYHGIYYYLNNGKEEFKQSFFYPLNGAYNAKIADYDKDGDLDIAAISFFPDWVNSPNESFVYLNNKGNNEFEASSFAEVNKGRWILLDEADYDGDGDLDLALGSLVMEVVPNIGIEKQWIKDGIPFVILQNNLNK